MPLVTIRRRVTLKQGGPQANPPRVQEPVDSIIPVEAGFRVALPVMSAPSDAGRFLSVDGNRLVCERFAVETNPQLWWRTWRLKHGWAMLQRVTEPVHVLCFFLNAPVYTTSLSLDTVSLQPRWLRRALDPKAGIHFSVALSLGEISGASPSGAWVACRRPVPGGVLCAFVGRWAEDVSGKASFSLGHRDKSVPLEFRDVEGIGRLGFGSAVVPGGSMSELFSASVGGICDGRAT